MISLVLHYYWNTHNRDSYDDLGASIISTAHYGTNFQNALWNGEQMVYGDSFPVNDVVAHELTHAITEHSANLEYRWQSGALNESFSDIFGAMVDRDDWLMGEDLPPETLGGREAIRDLADPPRFGSERMRYDGLREVLRRRAVDAKVEEPTPHDFRRAFALSML